MGDLKNSHLIYLKGFLFLVAGMVSAALILMENLTVRRVFLLGVAAVTRLSAEPTTCCG